MAQGTLPFKYEEQLQAGGMTALAGLPVYLDLADVMGLSRSVEKHLAMRAGGRGWTDAQVVTSLVLLDLTGSECVDDLDILEADEGFCRVLRRTYMQGLSRQVRRALERRRVKEGRRSIPSPSSVFRYLSAFHNSEQESLRQSGKAFIPAANKHLRGVAKVNRDLLAFVQKINPHKTATPDMDATLIETNKSDSFCFDQFAGSSSGSLTISSSAFGQGSSLIEMANRYLSKDSAAFADAFGMVLRSDTSQRGKPWDSCVKI